MTNAFDLHANFLKSFSAADALKDSSILLSKIEWLKNGEVTSMVTSFESTGSTYHHIMICREMISITETFNSSVQMNEIVEMLNLCHEYICAHGENKLALAVHNVICFTNQASPLACKYASTIHQEYFPNLDIA